MVAPAPAQQPAQQPAQPAIVFGQAGVAPVAQPNVQMFSTTVPPGYGPGMQVPVVVNGQQFNVPIPPGYGPGMQFQFRVPTGEIGRTLYTQAISYGGWIDPTSPSCVGTIASRITLPQHFLSFFIMQK
jgi:hypothetical protein